jgi:signal transduction histidine kinase
MTSMTFDDIAALAFQTLCTLALAAVHLGLWRQRRLPYHATWAAAWFVYALRLTFIAAFMRQQRELGWLFAHQVVTLWSGLLLLWAALQFATHVRWRTWMLAVPVLTVVWAWVGVFVMHSMATAGLSSALLLSAVTFGTGFVFLRLDRQEPSVGARLLAWGFLLWGAHHLDYPLLRAQGSGVLIGVFMDVTLLILVAVGTLVLVLGEERRTLAQRTVQLEQLSGLLLRAQEEERRRIARELHDEAGQTLTALKIELDLEGRREASTRVALVLNQIRNVSELLRPQALDDLGLVPALRALIEDFARRTQIQVEIDADDTVGWPPEAALTLYRVVQEALTNVARHSGAHHAWVRLTRNDGACRLVVEDDGTGLPSALTPHLGVLGMRERVGAAGGTLRFVAAGRGGLRVEATVPTGGGP